MSTEDYKAAVLLLLEEIRDEMRKNNELLTELNSRAAAKGNGRTDRKPATRSSKFVPPTIEEITEYAKAKGYSVDPEAFYNFYASKNWYVGKNKMSSWRHALAGFESRQKDQQREPLFTDDQDDIAFVN